MGLNKKHLHRRIVPLAEWNINGPEEFGLQATPTASGSFSSIDAFGTKPEAVPQGHFLRGASTGDLQVAYPGDRMDA